METKMKQKTEKLHTSEEYGRIPPQARELEEAIVAALMLEKQSFDTVREILTPEMFYDYVNEKICTAIFDLGNERKPIDMLTVVEQLRKTNAMDEVGGVPHIARLSQKFVSSAHLETHCLYVKEKYLRRRLIEIQSIGTGLAFDESEDIEDTIAKLNDDIEAIQEVMVGKNEINHIAEVAKESIDKMYVRIKDKRNGITAGIPTGFRYLDFFTNGWQKEKLVILAARPAVGKTSIAIKFAKAAATHGTPVAFFSLEMGCTELTDKMIVAQANINADRYASGEIQMPEWSRAETTATELSKLPIYIDDNSKATVPSIVNRARLLKKQNKCGMVIIDYLQLVTPASKFGKTREQEVSEMSRQLKVAAKELKIPFIVLCQMNREIESARGREPQLSDLRESGSIEQDADIVIFINRPGMHVEELRDKKTGQMLNNYLELLIKKHRGGKLGKVKVKHNDSMSDFEDWDDKPQLQPVHVANWYEVEKTEEETPF
ncbi:replicative DNA helicase [Bacteroidia bacterium]|nr:replicative DNA helicase [Bacteroidia bacterium]